MPVVNLITPVDPSGTFPVIPSGSNRLVFLTVNVGQSSGINAVAPSAVIIGGVSATFVAGDVPGASQLRGTLSTWMLNESQVSSMLGSSISITGQSGAFTRSIAWAVQGASQAIPTRKNNAFITTGAITMSLARAADSWTFFGAYVQTAEDITLANPIRISRILNVNIGYAADTARTVNSTTQSKTYVQSAHVINVEPAPLHQILSVNGGAGVEIGSTGNTAVTTGFANPITEGTLGGEPLTVTGYDAETGIVTFDGPVVVDQEAFPLFDSSQTIVFANDTEEASLTLVPLNPPTGSTLISVSSPENVDPRAFGYHVNQAYGFELVDGDIFYGVDADVEWLPNTYGSAEVLPVTTPVILRRTSTGIAYVMNVTVNPEGEVVTPIIISVGTVRLGASASVEVEDFEGPVNAGTLDGVALTSASNTSITVKGLLNNQTVPRPGERMLVLTDGDSNATREVLVNAPAGWGIYTVTADWVQAVNGVPVTILPVASEVGDFILFNRTPSAGKTTDVKDYGVVTNNVGSQTLWLVKNSTKVARSFVITTNSGAAGSGGQPANEDVLSMQPIRMVAL